MTLEEAERLLAQAPYTYARTMPQHPHHYTLRRDWIDGSFDDVVRTIRRYGYTYRFHGRPYTQLNANGFAYWTMGFPVEDTELINRRKLGIVEIYDRIAAEYDRIYDTPEAHAEDAQLAEILAPLEGTVLDVGCGTGLLNDLFPKADITGIDPSPGMLYQLLSKHPEAKVACTRLADFETKRRYDHVICLYGVVNYFTQAEIKRIPELCKPGGRWVIVAYAGGYMPKDGTDQFVRKDLYLPYPDRAKQLTTYMVLEGHG